MSGWTRFGWLRTFIASWISAMAVAITMHAAWTDDGGPSAGRSAPQGTPTTSAPAVNPALFQSLRFRSIGPHRGGRVTAVAGVRTQPCTFYMGAAGGGVWKTDNCGLLWRPVTDGQIAVGSIGAIDVAPSNPDIVFVGTGSACIRSNVSIGRGVYKSTDAGRTWSFVGLKEAGQIGDLIIHPANPDIVFVAALGNPFGPNPERGVFRTKDGGKTWQKVLFINDRTGVVALAINHSNPDEIYAGAWRGERKPWTIISGGPATEGGIYKSTDGGDTWSHLTNGLPHTLIGKVDVEVARSNPKVVYALIEAPGEQRGLYRSTDAGATWTHVNSDMDLIRRPFYYTHLAVDPKNPDIVWVNNEGFFKSEDGGKTFRRVPTPHGDNHAMWINPDHPEIFIQANDGGANVTLDGGRSWSTQLNQPTAEFYMVSVDERFPYWLYAPQQDNSTIAVPSLPPMGWGFDHPAQLWIQAAGCETGQIHPRPDGKVIYGVCKGEFERYSLETGQTKLVWVHPQDRYGDNPKNMKFRFVRQSPFEVSPHDPKVIYHGSQYVHRTTDEGVTWEIISPDLTANEPDKQVFSGEPITRDITGEEVYSALYAVEESRLERGVIWTGSSDGPVHVTRDGGKTWRNVTPKDLPPGGRVHSIEDSPHRKGSAYIAVLRYMLNDWQPYIYRTDDYGETWVRLTDGKNGIPADHPARVVREDPDREGLLYAGTEFGLFISFDNGKHWQPFQLNLPATPITDIRVHRKDLVISTMGRGFWILDNLTPLHQIAAGAAATDNAGANGSPGDSQAPTRDTRPRAGAPAPDRVAADGSTPFFLFQPRPAYRMRYSPSGQSPDEPEYPPPGAIIDYYFAREPQGEVKLEILDAKGTVVRSYSSEPVASTASSAPEMRPARGESEPARLPKRAGHNRFVWDLRHTGAWDPIPARSGLNGPHAVPGTYQVRLTAGTWSATRPLEIRIDPRVAADGVTQKDLEEQLEFNLRVRDTLSAARQTAAKISDALKTLGADHPNAARLKELHGRIVTGGGAYPQRKLLDQLANLYRMTSRADQRIGRSSFDYLAELQQQLDAIRAELARLGL